MSYECEEKKQGFTELEIKHFADAVRNAKKKLFTEIEKDDLLDFITIQENLENFIEYKLEKGISSDNDNLSLTAACLMIIQNFKRFMKDSEKCKWQELEFINNKVLDTMFDELKQMMGNEYGLAKSQKIKETLKSMIPETYYITNNKLSNEMTKDFVDKGTLELAVIKPNRKGEITTFNTINYEAKNVQIAGRYSLTPYDRAVLNAAYTLFEAGNKHITPTMVYRTLHGMTDTERVKPETLEAVDKSLEKCRFMRAIIDYTEEAQARGSKTKKAVMDGYLLPAETATVESGGHELKAYKFLKTPILYEYAQQTRQIISVPVKLLDTRGAGRSTEEIIPIKEYLIRRIEVMKHSKGKNTSNKILYDTIFEEAGITITDPKHRARMRSSIDSILKLWQTRDKYIKSYKEYKDGRTFKGIEITF